MSPHTCLCDPHKFNSWPETSYRKALQDLEQQVTFCGSNRLYYGHVLPLQGLVHITGGGFPENIPRVFPDGIGCKIDRNSWKVPELFRWVQQV